ncbi:MAG: GMC family oxidoreductase [Saprospiraceae bacterium]|nr:GMC family oxidoreductase [Saprospiraceae bacterium]
MQTNFDAIVIGSGISGGWAAKELCEQGLKTLVLERGRNVEHNKDYPTALMQPWDFKHRGRMTKAHLDANPLITKAAGYGEDTAHFFVEDADHPYVQQKPFDWIRGYQVGGKSLIWGRACQRWSQSEFESPGKYGYGIEWPIGYEDMAPWYSHVEKFIGVCGKQDGVASMPDGEYLPPFDFNCVEQHMADTIRQHWPDRHLVQGRWAQLSEPTQLQLDQGRGRCQRRNLCMRGCPYGGYFSSVTSTLPWAQKTGKLTVRPHSVVHSIVYDEKTGRASGVKVIDANTKEETLFTARIIFVNASALNSVLVLLNSKSERFPNGLGNDNGLLGKYVGYHNYRGYSNGRIPGFEDKYISGRNPAECILANYRNHGKHDMPFYGGYTIFSGAYRVRQEGLPEGQMQLGAAYKEALGLPGSWYAYMYMQGEVVPREQNRVYLHPTEKDQWGIPLLVTEVGYTENEELMLQDFLTESKAMLEKVGAVDIYQHDSKQAPGLDIHEQGGARMGKDPKTSLLNAHNQLHACPNVFVTDGACMTSTGNQSPSILYMALTARAAGFAVEQFKEGKL